MQRNLFSTLGLLAVLAVAPVVYAGSPHFTECSVEQSGNTLTVEGKEAGLGNISQVHIEVTATAECINPGGHNPRAANKTSVSAEGDFPVQNGKALFGFDVEATFQPDCSPPMEVEFSDIEVCDVNHPDVCCSL